MSEYIRMWLSIIENMNNDNTYKLAWGRALLELIVQLESADSVNTFSFREIGHKMLKYYWNQLYFFNLKQSANSKKPPVIVQETYKCIEFYKEKTASSVPVWFDRAESVLEEDSDFYDRELNVIARKLKDDVSWRFMNVKRECLKIYRLDKENMTVSFSAFEIKDLKEYAFVLSQLLNYRWSQLLEKFNNSPRIALKVKGISDEKIRRNSLKKYRDILLLQMHEDKILDFYSGKELKENDISVDHVIPWSFMYSV